jgi:hypothetical protein
VYDQPKLSHMAQIQMTKHSILRRSAWAPMREGQALVGRWGAWPSLVRSVMEVVWAEGPAKRVGHERDGEVPVRPFIPLPHAIRLRTDLGMW